MSSISAAPIRHARSGNDATTDLRLPRHAYDDATLNLTRRQSALSAPRRMASMRLSTASNAASARDTDNTTTHLDLHYAPRSNNAILRRRPPVSAILAERLAAQAAHEREEATARGIVGGRREARRRTIYVPDDTTVVTIHPASSLSSSSGRKAASSVNGEGAAGAQQRPVRRGVVLQRPKRRRSSVMPLVEEALDLTGVIPSASSQDMEALVEENEEAEDMVRPPQPVEDRLSIKARAPRRKSSALISQERQTLKAQKPVLQSLQEENAEFRGRQQERRTSSSIRDRKALNALSSTNANHRVTKTRMTPSLKASIMEQKKLFAERKPMRKSVAPPMERKLSDENVMFLVGKPKPITVNSDPLITSVHSAALSKSSSTALSTSAARVVSGPANIAVIKNDLARPELYEENWLEHHEIALTQLLNTFFESAQSKYARDLPYSSMRSKLMSLHNDAETPHLQKRLQASLMYGSLKVPEEVLMRSLRLKDDVGQRRKFLNLFLDTYDLTTLQAAAEAVAGREFLVRKRSSTGSLSGETVMHGDRKAVEQYLDHFFIQHADVPVAKTNSTTISALARDKVDQVGSPVWSWRRTVTKSLMLILLLDKAKQGYVVDECLFQATSCYKSSESVVQALGAMLLPSYGDLMRPLKHLKFELYTEQQPIEEFGYQVDNLATDLRDGIRLTRIVEILLGDCLAPSVLGQGMRSSWTLTQHLKYPCPGRSHKLQNVMAALSAMVRLPSMPEQLLKETTAYDIVDGHREKTLSLLWALLGQYAMESLVDWDLIRKETATAQQRLRDANKSTADMEDISDVQPTSRSKCWGMLFQWAMSVAALQDVPITNLTTCFAGQAAFHAIIQTYLPFLPSIAPANTPRSSLSTTPLESALKAAGCSTAFTTLLTAPHAIIPTRDFTLTSLTFLAARLLPAARAHRAATTLQRAWRLCTLRRRTAQRARLLRLAHHCAAVVGARDRVVRAAVVLQRGWRAVLDARIGGLEREVARVQCLARGWMARRRVERERRRGRVQADVVRERRAGW